MKPLTKQQRKNLSDSLKRHHLKKWNEGSPPKSVKLLLSSIDRHKKWIQKYEAKIDNIRKFYEDREDADLRLVYKMSGDKTVPNECT